MDFSDGAPSHDDQNVSRRDLDADAMNQDEPPKSGGKKKVLLRSPEDDGPESEDDSEDSFEVAWFSSEDEDIKSGDYANERAVWSDFGGTRCHRRSGCKICHRHQNPYWTLKEVQGWASNGCLASSVVRVGILEISTDLHDFRLFRLNALKSRGLYMFEFVMRRPIPKKNFYLFVPSGNDSVSVKDVAHPLKNNSSDTISQYKSWLKTCLEEHASCGSGEPKMLPTRVLSVGSAKDRSIRIVDGGNKRDRYMCLSYCWGGAEPMCTKATIHAFKEGIDWQDLPLTFQNTIEVAWNLDIRYVWIDTLCIIQDDEDDWQDECGKMASVYENSLLTVVATSSRHPTEGIFSCSMHEIMAKTFRGETASAYAYEVMDHFESWDRSEYPLPQRGWTYQERLLSPRLLHFVEHEVVWECNEGRCCQCGRRDELNMVPGRDPYPYAKGVHSRTLTLDNSPHELSERWREMLSEYSNLILSMPTDRLAALSGAASQMQRYRRSSYLAGLWEDSLLQDLLWALRDRPPEHSHSQILQTYPSWSWARHCPAQSYDQLCSLVYPLSFDDFTPIARVLHIPRFSAGAEVVSQVLDGALILHGPLVPAVVHQKGDSAANRVDLSVGGRTSLFLPDCDLGLMVSGFATWGFHIGDSTAEIFSGPDEISSHYLMLRQPMPVAEDNFERFGVTSIWKSKKQAAQELIKEQEFVREVTLV